MARTEMFRFLRRVVLDHAAAERLGMPVLEYREARQARTFSRRDVLKIGGVLGASTLLLGGRRAHAAVRDAPRIAIIGGGIAGLNAALTLADAGVRATVYEASDRVGGRMFSERSYWDGGQTSEYGGELIDTDHTVIQDLCARFGLGLTDVHKAAPRGSEDVLFFEGRYRSHKQFVEDFLPVYKALQEDVDKAPDFPVWDSSTPASTALSNMSVQEWIASRVPGGYSTWFARFVDAAYVVEYGAETCDQTAVNLVYMMVDQEDLKEPRIWGTSDERFHITGGNQRLPEAIAHSLPAGTVQHGWQLTEIVRRTDGGQTLFFSGHKPVQVDHTILTIPLGVLQRIDYRRAGFDPRMKGALANLRMGDCSKLNMQFSARPWLGRGPWPGIANGESFSDSGYQEAWDATAGQPGSRGIAIQYGGGNGAREFRPSTPFPRATDPYVRQAVRRKLAQIAAVVPSIRSYWTGKATLSAWHVNPLSYGAYSYYPIGYCHRFAGYEGQRQGNIHLAGEHTSVDFQGFMNGGAESGARAAQEILADISGK